MTTEQRTQAEIDSKRLSEEVQMLGEDQSSDFAFADRMLRKIVAENRQPNFTENTYFKAKLNWAGPRVNREIRRIGTVSRLQAIIGTGSQREELAKEKETACEIFEREDPRLEKEIAKLSKQKEQLQRAASNATRRCSEVAEALARLRSPELLRADVLEKYNERLQHFGETVQSKINALRIEISHRENCLNRPDGMDQQIWLSSIRKLAPQAVARKTESAFARWELTPYWADAQTTMLMEIESMKAEVASLESQRAAFDEEQKSVAELYILEAN